MQNITVKQKQILVEFISTNKSAFSPNSKNRFQREIKWEELAAILNANGPPNKEIEKWKQVSLWLE